MVSYQGILICGEMKDSGITATTKELLASGRRLADDLNQPLSIFLAGEDTRNAAEESINLGADKVYSIASSNFVDLNPDLFAGTIVEICKQVVPYIILFGHTDTGRDIAPRLAAGLNTGVTMDCIELSIDHDTKGLLQTKPVYGGNAVAVWLSAPDRTKVVTLRPHSASVAKAEPSRKGDITALNVNIDTILVRSKLVESKKEEGSGVRLEEAKVVVAGGGGVDKDGFKLLEELAGILKGTIGVSRVPCDEGWMPLSLEIGQTGHIVNPDLYIAIGISGAPQHMSGCTGSKCIVAINKDAEANIFKEADFGIIGDYREILPILIGKCKAFVK